VTYIVVTFIIKTTPGEDMAFFL